MMSDKHKDREALWVALPLGRENAETAAVVADRAGVNRRSAGTKLTAMTDTAYVSLGLRWSHDKARKPTIWWKEERDRER